MRGGLFDTLEGGAGVVALAAGVAGVGAADADAKESVAGVEVEAGGRTPGLDESIFVLSPGQIALQTPECLRQCARCRCRLSFANVECRRSNVECRTSM